MGAGDAAVRLEVVPISREEAFAFVEAHHRHRPALPSWKFGCAVADDQGTVRGVVVVGRPVARHLDDGWTLEVTRLCTDGARNACSMLYQAAWRASRALGYRRLITYIRADERGTSLVAAGWRLVGQACAGGKTWSRPSRPRVEVNSRQRGWLWERRA